MKEEIRYTTADSSLGLVLIARSEQGLCTISIGSAPAPLIAHLKSRFPRATIREDGKQLGKLAARVVASIEDPTVGLDAPLDIRGTDFQKRVWQALRNIPAGRTVTYADLARTLKVPHAVRAVGGACAANALAVVIPCHRVVRSDGGLSGYRWGVERKQRLLEIEGAR
jgi:AraC family transcriptional regulator of adaptative response/methylated-DNA-[protein]-cysteine methyltransferase